MSAMNTVEQVKETIHNSLADKSKPWYGVFEFLEKKTQLPKSTIFLGALGFCGIYLIFGHGAELLCNLIGVAYPAYASIHAIETSTKTDDTKWLTYWVTFAILSIVEYFSSFLLWIIPLYWLVKCVFLMWCMSPMQNNGADMIYNRIIRPYFLKHHQSTDKFIGEVIQKAKTTMLSAEAELNKRD